MTFLPRDFAVPAVLESERFRLRMLTVHDVVKDLDAVMSSRERLWELFGAAWGWPPADLSLEQDLVDIGWHQKEFQLRSSFNYAVMSPDESRLLGCVYIDPSRKAGVDAEIYYWTRTDELPSGLEDELAGTVRAWIEGEWPFARVVYPGRDLSWEEYDALPDPVGG